MIAYALGARTVRGNSTSSRTPPLGAALPRHTGLRTRHQRARQRIPGILHLAQRKCWRSAAGDPQTLTAPVEGIAGNAFCTRSKKCQVSTNDTYAAGARDSNHACRWLESMWVTICPSAYLIKPTAHGTRLPPPTTTDPPWNFHHVQPADFDPGKTYLVQATWISGIGCSINATIAIPNMSFTGIGSFGRGMPETRLRFDTVCTVFPRENRWLLDML